MGLGAVIETRDRHVESVNGMPRLTAIPIAIVRPGCEG